VHPSLRHLGLCGSLALGLSGAYAQTGSLKFDHISLEHGLSQSTVNAIVQDGQGFLWFGTQDGLNRYDGYTITVFKHSASDSSSISDNGVWSICRDVSGDIWIGTMRGGLNRYSLTRGSFTYFAHDPADPRSISENNVTAVFQDSRGSIWAGTLTNGLNRFDAATNSFLHFRHDPADTSSLADNAVWSICKTARGPSGLQHGEACAGSSRRTPERTGSPPAARARSSATGMTPAPGHPLPATISAPSWLIARAYSGSAPGETVSTVLSHQPDG